MKVTSGTPVGKIFGLCCIPSAFDRVPIPLQSVSVTASVVDCATQVNVVQVYKNTEKKAIDATYIFPLDSKSAVCGFRAETAEKLIVGVSKRKELAQAEYQDAIERGDGAYLLEQGQLDVFQAKIGNLDPGMEVTISITYVSVLRTIGPLLQFVLPTQVAPRYTPAEQVNAMEPSFAPDLPFRITLDLSVSLRTSIQRLWSPSHDIQVDVQGDRASVSFKREEELDRDVVVEILPENGFRHEVYIEKWVDPNCGKTTYAGMAVFCPKLDLPPIRTEVVFVVDTSGSMGGTKLIALKQAMQLFLRSLPGECFFNVVSFSSEFTPVFPSSVPYDDSSLSTAARAVLSLSARGGTNLLEPLEHVYTRPLVPGYSRQVMVLTDGEVSNVDQITSLIRSHADSARTFSLGLGKSVSHSLVEGIAKAGNGTSLFSVSTDGLAAKVMRQLRMAFQPAINDVSVSWTNQEDQMNALEPNTNLVSQAPFRPPPMFSEEKMTVFALFEDESKIPSKIAVSGISPEGPVQFTVYVDRKDMTEGKMLHVLLGRELITDLVNHESVLHSGKANPSEDEIREKVVEVGERYGLASKYTAFIAVEEKEVKSIRTVRMSRHVPQLDRDLRRAAPMACGGLKRLASEPPPLLLGNSQSIASPITASGGTDNTDGGTDGTDVDSSPATDQTPEPSKTQSHRPPVLSRGNVPSNRGGGRGKYSRPSKPTSGAGDEAPDVDAMNVMAVVMQQRADGSFNLSGMISAGFLRNLRTPDPAALQPCITELAVSAKIPEETSASVWGTALAVSYLETRQGGRAEEWKLLVEKAHAWLCGTLGGGEALVLQKATELLL
eukprot:Rmarinus@m.16642